MLQMLRKRAEIFDKPLQIIQTIGASVRYCTSQLNRTFVFKNRRMNFKSTLLFFLCCLALQLNAQQPALFRSDTPVESPAMS